jgi:uncharacterized membrane protein YhaH (DUF805 family)
MSLGSLFSTSGHLKPLPFAIAAIAVYLFSFGSQVLLSRPVTASMSVLPFVLVQAVLIWIWIVLHTRRLRDAGRGAGLAAGIAMVYALEIVLLAAIAWLILESGGAMSGSAGRESVILNLFVILYLLAFLSGDPLPGSLQIWVIAFTVLMLLPVAIGVGFSVWTATRASQEPAR